MAGTGGDGKLFAGQQFANLAVGVLGPRATIVELDVGSPVAEGRAALAAALIGKGQVVMGVCVAGRELNSLAVIGDRLVEPLQLIEHIT